MVQLVVGNRVYYTGDRANLPSEATVVATHEAGRYNPACVDLRYDEPRFEGDTCESRMVPLIAFDPGPGCRFWLLEDWNRATAPRTQ